MEHPDIVLSIGDIGSDYGGLVLLERGDNTFHWCVEDWDGRNWSPIPKYLAEALLKYEAERMEGVEL